MSVAIQHLSAVPKTPRELNPDIPEALELICMKAMCPDISKRYQTADAMLDDLEKFRKDPAVDMDYIREDLKAAVVCQEPTQPLPHRPGGGGEPGQQRRGPGRGGQEAQP